MESQPTQQKKLPKLTKKQRGFVNDYVLDENGTKAVMKHYDIEGKEPEKIASVIATQNLGKLNIIEAIEVKKKSLREALEDNGINEKKVAETIGELLDAKDDKGNKDYTAKDKGLKHTLSIMGIEDADKPKENVYNFFFEPKFQQNIRSYDENLKNLILNKDVEENKESI